MKKLLVTVFVLALVMMVLSCAFAAQGNANLAMDLEDTYGDSVSGGCVLGDTLYLQGYNNLYTWKSGEADVTAYAYDMTRYSVDSDEYSGIQSVLSNGEKLYALVYIQSAEADESGNYAQRMELAELSLQGKKACLGEGIRLDCSELLADNSFVSVSNSVIMDGTIYLTLWDGNGDMKLYAMPMDGSLGSYVDIGYPYLMTPYKDGQLLVETQNYDDGDSGMYLYDPANESVTTVKVFDSIADTLYGIVYSTESDRLFYLQDGYVMAVTDFDFENAIQVAQLSTAYNSSTPALLLPGDYYVSATYYAVCVRGTDPTAMPSNTINVASSYSNALISAYYSYGNSHPDTGVVLSTDGVSDDDLIQAMMNHDSSVDIYEVSVNSQAYSALFERGYMAELNDSDTLTEAVTEMYPAIREAISKDGKVYAVPTMTNGQTMAYYSDAFEKLGVGADDIPDNWPDFLALLQRLESKASEDGTVTLFGDGIMETDAKTIMLSAIWDSYSYYLNIHGEEIGYNTQELRSLLDTALNLDYVALGCQSDPEETEDGTVYYSESAEDNRESSVLLDSYSGCTIGDMVADGEPLLLSIVKGEEAPLPIQLTVAFVNPYTEHMDEALAYMEEVYGQLSDTTLYNLSDALNEPKRYSGYEETVRQSEKQIAEIEAKIDSADPVDKPVLEEQKQGMESSLESYKEYAWSISQREIDWYRGNSDRLLVMRFNYAYQSYSVYNLVAGLENGETTLDDFLQEVDHTSRMAAMEGN